jgi:hypothetical protein
LPEDPTDDTEVLAGRQEQGRAGVPKIVEANMSEAGPGDRLPEGPRDDPVVERFAGSRREDESIEAGDRLSGTLLPEGLSR